MTINEEYRSFMDDIDAVSFSTRQTSRAAFTEDRCQFLVNQEVLQDYHLVNYYDYENNIQLNAWGFQSGLDLEENDSILCLIISDFREEDTLQSQTMTDFRSFLMKAKRFFSSSLKEDFWMIKLTNNQDASELAKYIFENKSRIHSIKIIGITNTKIIAKKNLLIISENTTNNVNFLYDAWDFDRFNKIEKSQSGLESVDIDFVNDYGIVGGIPSLVALGNCPDISSYLLVLPASILAKMYENWNERLLEQNPRTFLQFTGKVNKAIRYTIINEPEKFFSYNNGISAVANDVELSSAGYVLKLKNLQIVNGGQTTASIYFSYLESIKGKRKVDLDKISVMMKLSAIKDLEKADEITPEISKYSNTQNKVAASAFSVRHWFHKTIEKYSRNIWTPVSSEGGESHWYYERVQGQYKNAIKLCKTKSEITKFENANPKKQMIKRDELAKYLLTFDILPHKVCLGAQKCYPFFCKEYLKVEEDGRDKQDSSVNEFFFKECCAKAILFRTLEKKVGQGIRFVVVPYTLALITKALKDNNRIWDYQKIWNLQWNIDILANYLTDVALKVLERLNSTQPEEVTLLSEWGKKEDCYNQFKDFNIDCYIFFEYSIKLDEYKALKKEENSIGLIDIGINNLEYVMQKGEKYWQALLNWAYENNLETKSIGIIKSATDFRCKFPSDKQAKSLMLIEKNAKREGFFFK